MNLKNLNSAKKIYTRTLFHPCSANIMFNRLFTWINALTACNFSLPEQKDIFSRARLFIHTAIFCLLIPITTHSMALPDDRYQAILIDADNVLLDEKKGLTRYSGNVILRQGTLQVKAEEITITKNKTTQSIDTMAATGNKTTPAYFEQQVLIDGDIATATAQRITYTTATQNVELKGHAELRQGAAIISSDIITYLAEKQLFQAGQDDNNGTKQRVQVSLPAPKTKPSIDSTERDR